MVLWPNASPVAILWHDFADRNCNDYWRRRASKVQKRAFALSSPALPTEGGREPETGANTLRSLAQGAHSDPQGLTPCRVGMSRFTDLRQRTLL